MSYDYEALNEQKFQKFAQALIVATQPNAQCLPVGQPDGGRDALFYHFEPDKNGFVVFQVKFSRNPESRDERTAVEALIKSEKPKVQELIRMCGAQHISTRVLLTKRTKR